MSIGKVWILLLVILFVCLFVRLRMSPPRIKLVASNFARRFIGVQGRESPNFVNFAPPEARNRTNRVKDDACSSWWLHGVPIKFVWRVDVGSACVDIRQSPKTDVLVQNISTRNHCGTRQSTTMVLNIKASVKRHDFWACVFVAGFSENVVEETLNEYTPMTNSKIMF